MTVSFLFYSLTFISGQAFDHNESMFDEGTDYSITEIASLEGSDFEYLE